MPYFKTAKEAIMQLKSFFTVIMILLMIPLASCAGGEDNIGEDGTRIARGYLTSYSADETRRSSVKIADDDLMDFYLFFSEGDYVKGIYGLPSAKPYVSVTFEKENENGEYVSTVEYTVLPNDKVDFYDPKTDAENGFRGKLPGAYDMAISYISESKSEVARASLGSVAEYDIEGKVKRSESVVGKSSRKLFYELDEADYVKGNDRTDIEHAYILVKFEPTGEYDRESGNTDEFRVYDDDYVMRGNVLSVSGWIELGHLKGAYKMLTREIERQIGLREKEVEAGFGFTSIMIQTAAGLEYELADFPEIDCLRVGKLLDGDVTEWWVLTIDSESEEDTLAAAEALKVRADVKLVNLNYLLTID